ncbi:RHS repeat domain-containing protein [Streptomyces sp. bgisy153]|uniref:RHS repeat domain-containing protein n=1 Tax=Streptomyces sp. bgisy153 TaxID=3413793 RepID=UPI003D73D18F
MYDKASRLTGKTTTGTAGSGTQSYGYDRTGRLTSWTGVDGTVTSYGWDAAGNRTSAGDVTAVCDERNRLLSAGNVTYTYSARGTRTGSTDTSGTHTAAFDAFGRMVSADGTAYAYDALGRLVQQGADRLTYADQSNNPVATAAGLVFRDPAGEAVSSAATDGTNARALLSDLHGDVTGAIDAATGELGASTSYSPFGEITARSGAAGPLGYQGEYTDPSTGQVNMHARWYDPATGGFSSRDSWTLNPVPSINANRYGYGNGNPLTNTDPSGHFVPCATPVTAPVCAGVGVGGAIGGPPGAAVGGAVGFVTGIAIGVSEWFRHRDPGPDNGRRPSPSPGPAPTAPHAHSSGGWYLSLPSLPDLAASIAAQAEAQERAAANSTPSGSGTPVIGYAWSHPRGGGGCGWSCLSVPCVWHCTAQQEPLPPPPPNWAQLIADALADEVGHPVTDTKTDDEFTKFVDSSLTNALKEFGGLSSEELAEYFKNFPDATDFCSGGLLGFQCTGNGNLLDPDTGVAYCNPAAGWTPGNTCVPLPRVAPSDPNVDPVEITVRWMPGMPKEQFRIKSAALQRLSDTGVLFKAPNPVSRDKSITDAYKSDFIRRVWKQFSQTNKPFAEQLVARIRRRMNPDHVWELQTGGPDDASNLHMLDAFTNQRIGNQIWQQLRPLSDYTPVRIKIEGPPQ